MVPLVRKICIVLCTIVFANVTVARTENHYHESKGMGHAFRNRQNKGKFADYAAMPVNKPVYHFYNFSQSIVREITLEIEIAKTRNPFFLIKLETSESLAETMKYNIMPLWLYGGMAQGGKFHVGSYVYQLRDGVEYPTEDSDNYYELGESALDIGPKEVVGNNFVMRIFVQPSHFLFTTDYGFFQVFYGSFKKREDVYLNFDSIHIEGDFKVEKCKIRTGGGITPVSNIPTHVTAFPYKRRIFVTLTPSRSTLANGVNKESFETFLNTRLDDGHGSWELVARGRTGSGTFQEFALLYGDKVMLKIRSYFQSTISGPVITIQNYQKTANGAETYVSHPINIPYLDEYFDTYSNNIMEPHTNFELSVRRLSNQEVGSNYPQIFQVTIRVKSRIATYYVKAAPLQRPEDENPEDGPSLRFTIEGDVKTYETVIMA